MKRTQWKMISEVGPLYLVASETGLQGIYWKPHAVPFTFRLEGVLAAAVAQLTEYFRRERTSFELPLDIQGTAFQRQVWGELMKIPYGETDSYRAIARRLQNPKAVRAVGAANGRNPLSIVVPCHRVIAADGTLCGYAGGLTIKSKLLDLERQKT